MALLPAACATAPETRSHVTTYPGGAPRWQVALADGVPDGPSTTWHGNGQVSSTGTYRAGKREGLFVYYDTDGAETRRDVYRADVLVSSESGGAGASPAQVAAVPVRPAPPAPAPDRYTDLRLAFGAGGTNAAVRIDGGDSSDDGEAAVSTSVELLVRRGSRVFGATLQGSSALWGAGHTYVGAVAGLAAGERAEIQLLAEGGVHEVSSMGDDLFETTRGNDSATLPYLGTQLRLTLDPGEVGHLFVDLSMTARTDLTREERDVMVESCFFGCSTSRETWRAGGRSVDVSLGLGYRFQ